jgi:hypothetical protein
MRRTDPLVVEEYEAQLNLAFDRRTIRSQNPEINYLIQRMGNYAQLSCYLEDTNRTMYYFLDFLNSTV